MHVRRAVVSAAVLVSLAGSAHATIRQWIIAGGGNFSQATAWSPNGVPGAGDELLLTFPGLANIACNGLAATTSIEQYRSGNVRWSSTVPHTVTSVFSIAALPGNSAQFTITSGELVTGTTLSCGLGAGSVGSLTVEGAASVLRPSGAGANRFGGSAGSGTLNVTAGGRVLSSGGIECSSSAALSSAVNVTGAGSLLEITGATSDLLIAATGTAQFLLDHTAVCTVSDDVFVANAAGATGGMTVTALASEPTRSRMTIAGDLFLARNLTSAPSGTATCTIGRHAEVTVGGTLSLGDPDGGTASLTIANYNTGGPNGTLVCSGLAISTGSQFDLQAGLFRVNGPITVQDGQFVVNSSVPNTNGFMNVTGACSVNTIRIGTTHNGSLTSSGVTNCTGAVSLAQNAGSTGQLTIHTGGSLTSVGQLLTVGQSGNGILSLTGGGAVAVGALTVGANTGSNSSVSIQGPGSILHVSGTTNIGRSGGGSTAVVTVAAPGRFTGGPVSVWPGGSMSLSGATLESSELSLRGGTLSGFGAVAGICMANGSITPTSTGLIFNGPTEVLAPVTGTAVTFNAGLTARGTLNAKVTTAPGTVNRMTALTNLGDGSATGANLRGLLDIGSNAVSVLDSNGFGGGDFSLRLGFGTIFSGSEMSIDQGALIRGTGAISTSGVRLAGDIYPGDVNAVGIGTINVTNALGRGSAGFGHYHIDIANAGEGGADAIYAGGDMVLGGNDEGATITLSLINGYVPVRGTMIQILGAGTRVGTFANENLPLGWYMVYAGDSVFALFPCESDFNKDGAVDGDDVIAFFAAWDAGIAEGDVTGDGGVDGDDVIFFFEHWDSGC